MTIIALVLSILVGTGSLAIGYYQAGLVDPARWFVLLGLLWLAAHYRRWYWFSALGLFISVFGAGYGVWNDFRAAWMLLGALGGLLGWDLSDFAMRLRYAAPTDDIKGMERSHLARVGVVAALGLGLAYLSTVIQVRRLAFEAAVGLVLLAALGLTRLAMRLRRY